MKNSILIAFVVTALVILFWWFSSVVEKTDVIDIESISETSVQASVLVAPQPNSKEIKIQKAVLTEPGFIVLREVIGGTAAQIVEISRHLESGTYTDISIPVGEFYTGNSELMVIVYADAGDDQILNDLDQPFIDIDGSFVATYVTTGLPVADKVFNPNQGVLQEGISLGNMTVPTVTYTNSGFEPAVLEVAKGSMVHFVNKSDTSMWVASNSHPAHDILPTFDQFKTGDMYMYIFEESGEWEYHDHRNAAFTGVIQVTD